MTKLALGCPVFEREWALSAWFQSIFDQKINLKSIDLIFAYTKGKDKTLDIIEKYGENFNDLHIIPCNDVKAFGDRNSERYYSLVILRNRIILKLRELQPDYYMSWDSDIILPEETLRTLLKDDKDIVGPWVDLAPPLGVPNTVTMVGSTFRRKQPYEKHYPTGSLYKVDTIFAVFLMKNKVFNACTYKYNSGGEDYGFAEEVKQAGFESWMDARFIGQHLYHKP